MLLRMTEHIIDMEPPEDAEYIYVYPQVRPETVVGSCGFIDKLRAMFRFRDELILGQSAVPVLRAAHIASGEPEWLLLVADLERHGNIVLTTRKAGWVWSPPADV